MEQKKNYITFAEYKAFEAKIMNHPVWKEKEGMWKELREMYKHLMPEVGMGATEVLWSDRRAKTITRVITPNKIEVMENEVVCKDYYNSEYEILGELNPHMGVEVFTRRKSGRWIPEGRPDKYGEVILAIGRRSHYIDPTF